jgi:hypothetical protein
VRKTGELGNNLFSQLKDNIYHTVIIDCLLLAIDETTDNSDTAKLLIFIRCSIRQEVIYVY